MLMRGAAARYEVHTMIIAPSMFRVLGKYIPDNTSEGIGF